MQEVSNHVIWKIETFIEEYTRYKKHCTSDNDASVSVKVGMGGPHTVLPITISCPVMFSWNSSMIWNIFPFKGDFNFRENQKSQGTKSGLLGGLSHLGYLMFCKNTLHKMWCMSRNVVMVKLPIISCPSCGLLNHLNSFCGGMFKLNAKCDADSLLYSLSHFECDDHTVHMLTQWCLLPPLTSTVKSSLLVHVHSSPLSLVARLHWSCSNHYCCTNNGWTFSGQTSYFLSRKYKRVLLSPQHHWEDALLSSG